GRQLPNLLHVGLNLLQGLLPQQLHILGGHKTALGGERVNEPLPLQLLIGPLGGDDADAQVLGQVSDGGEGLVRLQFPADDLIFDLGVNLIVDGGPTAVVNVEIQTITSFAFCVYTVYTVDTALSIGLRNFYWPPVLGQHS